MLRHENRLLDGIVRGEDKGFVSRLKLTRFDVGFGLGVPHEILIAKAMGLPYVKWETYLPEP